MITIILPISRRDYLKPVFDCLAELEKPKDTELLIILDGSQELEQAVGKRTKQLKGFASIKAVEFGGGAVEGIRERRSRIATIHNMAANYISDSCDKVLLIEDDGTFDKLSLSKLLKLYEEYPNAGSVSGVQIGRHNANVVGVWYTDNVDNASEISTLPPSVGTQEIDAAGMYFLLTLADLYRKINHKPFGDEVQNNLLGPDVNYGLHLRRLGYKNYVDWQVNIDHLTPKGTLSFKNTMASTIKFRKRANRWDFSKQKNIAQFDGATL